MKRISLLAFLIHFSLVLAGQEVEKSQSCHQHSYVTKQYNIFFESGVSKIDHSYYDNADVLYNIKEDIETSVKILNMLPDSVLIKSTASPDGKAEHNAVLAENRAANTKAILLAMFPDLEKATFRVEYQEESWDGLKQVLLNHNDFPQGEQMLAIIDSSMNDHSKEMALRQCAEGWSHLVKNNLYVFRTSSITITLARIDTNESSTQEAQQTVQAEPETVAEEPQKPVFVQQEPLPKPISTKKKSGSNIHLKTNLFGLAAGIANAAVEFDLAKHWSLTIPIYYSAWDYFKPTWKFRTLAVQPEVRFWFDEDNTGFFTGAHFGLGYYNVALGADYRYQDHNMQTPSIGGGLAVGYRLPISRNNRWNLEFTLGAGVYPSHYDKFHNTPVTENGLMISDYKRLYWGIDQAALSFSYAFGINTKGGNR